MIVHTISGQMYQKREKMYLQLHFFAIDLFKNFFSYLTILDKKCVFKETQKSKLDLDLGVCHY